MNTFLACISVSATCICAFILADIHHELVRIRKALTKKVQVNQNFVVRKWEPIETNGWAGEPQGKEHAP